MPEITINMVKGIIDQDAKVEMMSRVSEVVAEIITRPHPKENLLPFVYCTIQEAEWGNFATNGMPMTPEMFDAVKKGIVHLTMEELEE
jgi:phenylpyruvate tautomerase PptA (4-oxalocrotonate tautomerase family)